MSNELATKPGTLQTVDWSLDGLMAIVLPKSRSTAYPAALALAQAADHYIEQAAGKQVYHLAGFGRSHAQAARALELLRLARPLKGVQVFMRGALHVDLWQLDKVLKCYLQACAATDPRAHCMVVVDEPTVVAVGGGVREPVVRPIDVPRLDAIGDWLARQPKWQEPRRLVFPCRHLLHRNFRFQPDHPAGRAAEIQAAAVREGCDWCPFFTKGDISCEQPK